MSKRPQGRSAEWPKFISAKMSTLIYDVGLRPKLFFLSSSILKIKKIRNKKNCDISSLLGPYILVYYARNINFGRNKFWPFDPAASKPRRHVAFLDRPTQVIKNK